MFRINVYAVLLGGALVVCFLLGNPRGAGLRTLSVLPGMAVLLVFPAVLGLLLWRDQRKDHALPFSIGRGVYLGEAVARRAGLGFGAFVTVYGAFFFDEPTATLLLFGGATAFVLTWLLSVATAALVAWTLVRSAKVEVRSSKGR